MKPDSNINMTKLAREIARGIIATRCPEELPFFQSWWEVFERFVASERAAEWISYSRSIQGLGFADAQQADVLTPMVNFIVTGTLSEITKSVSNVGGKKVIQSTVEQLGKRCGAGETLRKDLTEDLWRVRTTWMRHKRDAELRNLVDVAGTLEGEKFTVYINGQRQEPAPTQDHIAELEQGDYLVFLNEAAGKAWWCERETRRRRNIRNFNRYTKAHKLLVLLLLSAGRKVSYDIIRESVYPRDEASTKDKKAVIALVEDLFVKTLRNDLEGLYVHDRRGEFVVLSSEVTSCVILRD